MTQTHWAVPKINSKPLYIKKKVKGCPDVLIVDYLWRSYENTSGY